MCNRPFRCNEVNRTTHVTHLSGVRGRVAAPVWVVAPAVWGVSAVAGRTVVGIPRSGRPSCHNTVGQLVLVVGRTSLSLALGNMVITRQILLIFNLSYLPCSVQLVNKNYCQAKNDLFTTCWCHYFVREWCEFGRSFNEHTKQSETEHDSDVESQMSGWKTVVFGKPLGTFTRKTYTHEVITFRKSNSCRFIRYEICLNSLFSTTAKTESKNTFIFTLDLHQKSLNAPYWIW